MRRIWLSGMDSSIAPGFRDTLLSHGYVTEQSPTDIFKALRGDTTPTAIVVSVVDAGMYGLNALVSARKAVPRIPVLVLVQSDQAKVAVEALKLGATEVCVMPVNPADLLSFLRKVQDNHRASATALEYSLQSVPDTAVFLSRNPNMLERDAARLSVQRARPLTARGPCHPPPPAARSRASGPSTAPSSG